MYFYMKNWMKSLKDQPLDKSLDKYKFIEQTRCVRFIFKNIQGTKTVTSSVLEMKN